MKRLFFFAALLVTTLSLSAQQRKMQLWEGNYYSEFAVSDVDSVTFLSVPAGTPKPPVIVHDTVIKEITHEIHDTLYIKYCPEDHVINGVFSVSATKQVRFATGNLCYVQSTAKWSLAENQYDMLDAANVSGSQLADTIDLFGWSALDGAATWGISTSESSSDYSGSFVDWGLNFGTDAAFRTLTQDEWDYLSVTRANANRLMGIARIKLNATEYVNGLILLPDNWTCPTGLSFNAGFESASSADAYDTHNSYTLPQWKTLEAAGAVFLPASGYRQGATVSDGQNVGYYWSSTVSSGNVESVNYMQFRSSNQNTGGFATRIYGRAVRLVQDL